MIPAVRVSRNILKLMGILLLAGELCGHAENVTLEVTEPSVGMSEGAADEFEFSGATDSGSLVLKGKIHKIATAQGALVVRAS